MNVEGRTMLSSEEFVDKLKELDISVGKIEKKKYNTNISFQRRSELTMDNCIYIEWVVGGMTGGSCWGGEPYARDSDPEPEFEELLLILETLTPKISLLDFKKVEKIIQTTDGGESGYYGNYTNTKIKYIVLKDLYDKLVELQLV